MESNILKGKTCVLQSFLEWFVVGLWLSVVDMYNVQSMYTALCSNWTSVSLKKNQEPIMIYFIVQIQRSEILPNSPMSSSIFMFKI